MLNNIMKHPMFQFAMMMEGCSVKNDTTMNLTNDELFVQGLCSLTLKKEYELIKLKKSKYSANIRRLIKIQFEIMS